jgi:SAM-dependent methyltransferase
MKNIDMYKLGFETIMKKNKYLIDDNYNYNVYFGNTQRAEFLIEFINTIKNSDKYINILDIGGGYGSIIEHGISYIPHKKFTIDLIEPILSYRNTYKMLCKKFNVNFNFYFNDFDDFNKNISKINYKYNFIFLIHSIYYYLNNYEYLINKCRDLLNENGKIILIINDFDNSDIGKFEKLHLIDNNNNAVHELLNYCKTISYKYIYQHSYFYAYDKKELIPTLFISNIIKKQDDEEFDNKYISKAMNYINNNVTIETRKIQQNNTYRLYNPQIYIEINKN